ncbi:hypothetical protein O1L55_41780 [Streptomyces albulus]|nr:hypothetical protein [Streptomyces noursei]
MLPLMCGLALAEACSSPSRTPSPRAASVSPHWSAPRCCWPRASWRCSSPLSRSGCWSAASR